MLNNTGSMMDSDTSKHQKLTQGRLSDALINGEITESVKELRWRTYKILNESQNLTTKIVGYDEDNLPITVTTSIFNNIRKLKVDESDTYKPIMVIKNEPIIVSTTDIMNTLNINEDNTLIDFDTINSQNEVEYPIEVERETITALEIEKYSKKLVIREIDGENFLLEFYIPMYSDEYNKKSKFIISEIKKIIKKPLFSSLTDIKKVKFITNKSIGVLDNLFFEYDIKSFYKIVEFNGFYVIKFKSRVINNGSNILLDHIHEGLEEKYKNKEKK